MDEGGQSEQIPILTTPGRKKIKTAFLPLKTRFSSQSDFWITHLEEF